MLINSYFKRAAAFGSALSLISGLAGCQSDPLLSTSSSGNPSSAPVAQDAAMLNSTTQEKPNIVCIVLDDMGFSDLGCYGSEINTPNINKLAENGLRYNNFQVIPVSSPTRAALLTGRNPHSVGLSRITNYNLGVPHSTGEVAENVTFLPQILLDAGYNTFGVGKWHLAPGWEQTAAGPFKNWPVQKGFERFYGFLDGETNQYAPELISDNHHIEPSRDPNYHVTTDITDQAIALMRAQQTSSKDNPFMLYYATGAMHRPIQVPKEYMERYSGVYEKGWDFIREERFQRQKELGIIPQNAQLSPRDPKVKEWNELTVDEQKLFVEMQKTYAGFLEHTDEQIGRLIQELEQLGQLDNTLIMLISDNGASNEGGVNGAINLSGVFNGIPCTVEGNLSNMDQLGLTPASYPTGWAQVSCTPFSGYKGSADRPGGFRVPLIVHYPNAITKEQNGNVREQFVNVTDVSPTIYDMLGITYPTVYRGIEQMELHGISFADTIKGTNAPAARTRQYFEMFGTRGLYDNGWFLAFNHKKGTDFKTDTYSLYDVANDYSMQNDVSGANPDKVNELLRIWEEEAKTYGVYPLDDRRGAELALHQLSSQVKEYNSITLYPGVSGLNANKCSYYTTLNRSYTLTADVTRTSTTEEGVLLSIGGDEGGMTFYVKDNRLSYEYNYIGNRSITSSSVEIPLGDVVLKAEYEKTGLLSGKATVFINGDAVGSTEISTVYPILFNTMEGMSAGEDTLTPVSEAYADKGSFSFSGTLHQVRLDAKDDYNDPAQMLKPKS